MPPIFMRIANVSLSQATNTVIFCENWKVKAVISKGWHLLTLHSSRSAFLTAAILLGCRVATSQGIISTVAGGNGFLDDLPGTQARLDGPNAVAVDAQGNAYIGDGSRIRRVDATTNVISTVAGGGTEEDISKGGKATHLYLGYCTSFVFDGSGSLVFLRGGWVLKLDLRLGTITTIAGGPGTLAQLGTPEGVATDRAGNVYVTDSYWGKIYRIDPATKAITTIAGTGLGGSFGSGSPSGDGGPAIQASLGRPGPITLDAAGNIYFAEQYWLRRIDGQTGKISTIAPVSVTRVPDSGSGDGGPVSKAVLANPFAVATDSNGNLYIADGVRVRKIDWSTGTITTVAGSGQQKYTNDGVPALQANLSAMPGIAVDAAGNLWLGDYGNRRLFVIPAATGKIRTVAGTSANGDGGPARGAILEPTGLAVSPSGDLYIGEALRVRRVDAATGFISTIATVTGDPPYGGQPVQDTAGNLYVASKDRVSRIDPRSGGVSIVAGGTFMGFSGDGGPATAAQMSVSGIGVDGAGNLYIADYLAYRIRRVDAKTGIITTVAGNGLQPGKAYAGATGPATQIAIGPPTGLAISPGGEVYWTTTGWILKLDSAGRLAIAAGNGGCVYAGDGGPALLASLCQPYHPIFDGSGNLFVAESDCGCVRRIDAATGLIQTIAGTGSPGTSVDGIPATQAALTIRGLALAGPTLFIGDKPEFGSTARIRAVTPAVAPPMPQPPKVMSVVNAVDYRHTYSPGAIVSVMGNYLAGPAPESARSEVDGKIGTALGGDGVTFKGIPSPLLYVSAAQINAVVPYAVPAGSLGTIPVQVQTAAGADSANLDITRTSPALFAGLILNPDGSWNSVTHPAPKGATLVLYGTGMGQTIPPGVDGAIMNGPDFPSPVARFAASVRYGTLQFPAEIVYLGPLPGFVAGAMQVNVRIPDTVPAGPSELNLSSITDGRTAQSQTIYMLSDPPVLTGITPAPPIAQTRGNGNYITLNGTGLRAIVKMNFFLGGAVVDIQPQPFGCTDTACQSFVNFAGRSGEFGVEVVNAAQQVSNRLTFAVQPFAP